jgi:hypothetical protein
LDFSIVKGLWAFVRQENTTTPIHYINFTSLVLSKRGQAWGSLKDDRDLPDPTFVSRTIVGLLPLLLSYVSDINTPGRPVERMLPGVPQSGGPDFGTLIPIGVRIIASQQV